MAAQGLQGCRLRSCSAMLCVQGLLFGNWCFTGKHAKLAITAALQICPHWCSTCLGGVADRSLPACPPSPSWHACLFAAACLGTAVSRYVCCNVLLQTAQHLAGSL